MISHIKWRTVQNWRCFVTLNWLTFTVATKATVKTRCAQNQGKQGAELASQCGGVRSLSKRKWKKGVPEISTKSENSPDAPQSGFSQAIGITEQFELN